jgi:integrase
MAKKPVHIEALPGGTWRARITHPITKRRISITASSELKVAARIEQIRGIKQDLLLGQVGIREAERAISVRVHGAPTVRELWDAYTPTLWGRHAENIVGVWKNHLEPYFGKARVYELTPEMMARWERKLLENALKPKTICNVFWSLRAAVHAAIPHRLDEVPWRRWRPRPRPQDGGVLSRDCCRDLDEFRLLMRAAKAYDEKVKAKQGYADTAERILFLAFTGARQAEACGLGWDCVFIDQERAELRIHYQAPPGWTKAHPTWKRPLEAPKMNKKREATMHPAVAEMLRAYREKLSQDGRYRPEGPVFPNRSGGWRTTGKVLSNRVLREIVEAAGFDAKNWVVHSLRHTFGTLNARGAMLTTGDIVALMAVGGWAKHETAFQYIKAMARERPSSFIPALPQAELPGVGALPGPAEMRRLEVARERQTESLVELSREVVVRVGGDARAERNLSLAEIAARHAGEPGIPKVVRDMAKAKYAQAYRQAQRDKLTPEECAGRANAARIGFLSNYKRQLKKAAASTDEPFGIPETPELGSPDESD